MVNERFELAIERMEGILMEEELPDNYKEYFRFLADFLLKIGKIYNSVFDGSFQKQPVEKKSEQNKALYEDIRTEHYGESYANPDYASVVLGEELGPVLSALYAELRSTICYAFEKRLSDIVIRMELYLEVYGAFLSAYAEMQKAPSYETIKQIIYWFVNDYIEDAVSYRTAEQVDASYNFAKNIIMNADLSKEDYLYDYGEYISENELKTAAFFAKLPQETVTLIAKTYTEGYRKGFAMTGKDITKKKTVNIRYSLGFERVIRESIVLFHKMGLDATVYRAAVSLLEGRGVNKVGYFGGVINKQFDYDHKEDSAIYLDKHYVNRRLEVLKMAYESCKEKAATFGGPAVMETFGEEPFAPGKCEHAFRLSEKQQKLSVEFANEASEIVNKYIPGEERSFTIIAFPTPEIGKDFEEIFQEIIKINTLDYNKYLTMQQTIIDALDQAKWVEVKGKGDNRTNIKVYLAKMANPQKETCFENCVADVNIPVGEVFTSPVLEETEGILHVSRVFLNGLEYKDLWFSFKDGFVADYGCGNFEGEEEGRKYIKENVLHHHATLPIGEFAIGTNTTAFVAARKYKMEAKLPILIAEKTGPHFALGDTCYSHEEDVKTYNPNGKEIIAKKNSAGKYFNCHTDVTIPYDEIAEIAAVKETGERIPIILDGTFHLPGVEELNRPFFE